jgi:hypothetical protein
VEAAEQTLQAYKLRPGEASGQLTLRVLGHQVVEYLRSTACSFVRRSLATSYSHCLSRFSSA